MKHPSGVLHRLADELERLEEFVEEAFREKVWRYWEWWRYREEARIWKRRAEAISRDYWELHRLYRQKTGEDPPRPSSGVHFPSPEVEETIAKLKRFSRK